MAAAAVWMLQCAAHADRKAMCCYQPIAKRSVWPGLNVSYRRFLIMVQVFLEEPSALKKKNFYEIVLRWTVKFVLSLSPSLF